MQLWIPNEEMTSAGCENDVASVAHFELPYAAPTRASSAPGTPSVDPGSAARSEDDESDIMDEELLLMLERQKEVRHSTAICMRLF